MRYPGVCSERGGVAGLHARIRVRVAESTIQSATPLARAQPTCEPSKQRAHPKAPALFATRRGVWQEGCGRTHRHGEGLGLELDVVLDYWVRRRGIYVRYTARPSEVSIAIFHPAASVEFVSLVADIIDHHPFLKHTSQKKLPPLLGSTRFLGRVQDVNTFFVNGKARQFFPSSVSEGLSYGWCGKYYVSQPVGF